MKNRLKYFLECSNHIPTIAHLLPQASNSINRIVSIVFLSFVACFLNHCSFGTHTNSLSLSMSPHIYISISISFFYIRFFLYYFVARLSVHARTLAPFSFMFTQISQSINQSIKIYHGIICNVNISSVVVFVAYLIIQSQKKYMKHNLNISQFYIKHRSL